MASSRISLNTHIDWRQVLPLLGIETDEQPMPALTVCPLCRGRMVIFDDTRFGGNWHHCMDCDSIGDMIALAARSWKCSPSDAIYRLARSGVTIPTADVNNEAVGKYVREYVHKQDKHAQLQADSRNALNRVEVKIARVLQQCGFPNDQAREYWPRRMGRFMGAATRKRVYQGLYKAHDDFQKMKDGGRVLKGPGWRDVLTIPFKSLPGQYAGWLLIGREGRKHKDYAFFINDQQFAGHQRTAEVGACMYETLDSRTAHKDRFGDTMFVFDDPVHALKMQAKHMRDSDLPLPLLGTYNALVRTKRVTRELITHNMWTTRPDKKFIFWGPAVTANLFNMASRANGHICISRMPMYLSRKPPHQWLIDIQSKAMRWDAVLETQLRRLPDEQAVTILRELDIPVERMQQFKADCADDVRQLLDRNKRNVQLLSTARVGGKDIVETAEGWYTAGKAECISNAILRLERVLCVADDPDSEPYYSGRILFDGQEFPFNVPMETLEKNPGLWMRKKLLVEAGKLIVVKRGWNTHLLDIARQFHEPEIIREDGVFGWRAHDSCFALPQFSVHLGGEVVSEPASFLDEWTPGGQLAPPVVTAAQAALLRDTPSNRLFWAATACIGANVLSPAIGQRGAGLALVGHGALMLGRATARANGCKELRTNGQYINSNVRTAAKVDTILQRHAWPLLVQCAGSHRILSAWLNGDYQHNIVMDMPELQALAASTIGAWRIIRESVAIAPGPEVATVGPTILPVWLQRVCRRKLKLPDNDTYVHAVVEDMADMMSAHGNADVVRAGGALIDDGSYYDEKRAAQLVRLAYTFIEDGRLRFVHESEAHKWQVPLLVLTGGGEQAPAVFLGQETWNTVLAYRKLVLPDPGKMTDTLQIANALDGETTYNGEKGWLINEAWWSRQVEYCRASRHLKVVGGGR